MISMAQGPRACLIGCDFSVCVNCREQPYSSAEHLCDKCLRKLERVECTYCHIVRHSPRHGRNSTKKKKKDFHRLDADAAAERTVACHDCWKKASAHGAPSACSYCGVQAAWSGGKCSRCERLELEHGAPSPCDECGLACAFEKEDAAQRAKVDGLLLCFLCTRKFKRRRHAEERRSASAVTLRSPEQWRADCDELQRRLADAKKAAAAELKQSAAAAAPVIASLTAQLDAARAADAAASRQLRDTEKLFAPLSTETYALEMRHRGLMSECDVLADQCAQLSLEMSRLTAANAAATRPQQQLAKSKSSNSLLL